MALIGKRKEIQSSNLVKFFPITHQHGMSECFKEHVASQWKCLKFDPESPQNA